MSSQSLKIQQESLPFIENGITEDKECIKNFNTKPRKSVPLIIIPEDIERSSSSEDGSGSQKKIEVYNSGQESQVGFDGVEGEKVVKNSNPRLESSGTSCKNKISTDAPTSECNPSFQTTQKVYNKNVDGGWAFVVLIAVFIGFFIRAGMQFTCGIYYTIMLEEYGHSRSYTSLLGSLSNTFNMLMGPASAAFIRRFGVRSSMILGSLLMTSGYFVSAFTTSLEHLFLTYGVIGASGMNFAFSGMIIALSQYFEIWNAIATSIAMTGIGFGMFFLSRLMEYCIENYGWRGSYIFNAGISLHMLLCGQLIFPLSGQPRVVEEKSEMLKKQSVASYTSSYEVSNVQKTKHFHEKNDRERSFSSLRMSVEAGYISSSILSIDLLNSYKICRNDTVQDLEARALRSNQGSFISRGSNMTLSGISNNPHSFHVPRRSAWGTPVKSFSGKDSATLLETPASRFMKENSQSNIRNNSNSFIRDIPNGVIQRNPQSFVRYYSISENESYQGEDQGKGGFTIGEEEVIIDQKVAETIVRTANPLCDPRFWLMDFACFLGNMGLQTLFVIYKDLARFLGVADYYSSGLSAIGIGDMIGRLSAGALISTTWADPLLSYSIAMGSAAGILAAHLLVNNSISFLILAVGFGFLFGFMNVLMPVAPSKVFGRDQLVTVFGNLLFLSGIGSFCGPPITGKIADITGSYVGVVYFSVLCMVSGGILMFSAYLVNKKKIYKQEGIR